MMKFLQDSNVRNDNPVRRKNSERWRHQQKNNATGSQRSAREKPAGRECQNRCHTKEQNMQLPQQWVSSCGCVHNTWGEGLNNGALKDSKLKLNSAEVLCGGCGCICGDGHRHFNQKCGTECQLICCNAHGLRVNRSRARKRSIFLSKRSTWANITM